jgi:hypothetical protein
MSMRKKYTKRTRTKLPLFVSKRRTCRVLDIGPAEYKALVDGGHLEVVPIGDRRPVSRKSLKAVAEMYG